MTSPQLLPQRRLSGATLFLGALLSAVGYFLEPSTARDSIIVPASWLIFSGTILLLISLPWFHVGQAARAGVLDWWGTVLICVGLGLANFPTSVIGIADRHYLDDDSVFHASAAGSAEFLGLMVLLVGVIITSITTVRAGVYPRWAGWSLIAMVVVSLVVQFVDALSTAIHHPAEIYLLVAVLGVAVMTTPTGTRVPDAVPVPAA
jgi:hypothetical protein